MNQDYRYAQSVLQDLGYTKDEASEIIEVIKLGNYAFPCKKADSVDLSKRHIWMQDECTGIDVPVLWIPNQEKSSKTIILLAQDPLRDNDYWNYTEEMQHNTHVIVGTPYALHISEETKRKPVVAHKKAKRYNVGVYKDIIKELCEGHGYNVYCTDIFKYYMRETPCSEIAPFDVEIFINECKRVNPAKIIAMGKKAQEAVAELQIEQNKIISVPHPKARPQRTTEQIVNDIIEKL